VQSRTAAAGVARGRGTVRYGCPAGAPGSLAAQPVGAGAVSHTPGGIAGVSGAAVAVVGRRVVIGRADACTGGRPHRRGRAGGRGEACRR
jgi:hypothetical protein